MSVQTLYTAASGMEAMETKLDVIANNLANINTTAFKKDRANFEDLLYRAEVYPGALDATQTPTAVGTQVEPVYESQVLKLTSSRARCNRRIGNLMLPFRATGI